MFNTYLKSSPRFSKYLLFITVLFVEVCSYASVTDTLSVYSNKMAKNIEVLIVKPEEVSSTKTSVVFLLHGYDGDAHSWLKVKPNLGVLADQYNMVFICPESTNSWYWDSPLVNGSKYETFIAKELYPYISKVLQIQLYREKVAITGLSMGGHGAFWIAGKYPQLFGAIGSMSGGLDLTSFKTNWNLVEHLGKASENSARWRDYTVASHLERYAKGNFAIIFDCGVEDFFYPANEKVHQAMVDKKIPHDFISRPGVHNSIYWSNSLDYQLLFFDKFFNKR